MSGFPTRTSRAAFGPQLSDMRPVVSPQKSVPANAFNAAFWDLAGLAQTGAKAVLKCTVDSGVVTVAYQGLAFDPDGVLDDLLFTTIGRGVYGFELEQQYDDELGNPIPTGLIAGIAMPVAAELYTGEHTGADDEAVLTDGTKAWTTNALVGFWVYNYTDGSCGTISANTATTVTATLAGGTENDWDTDDVYGIYNPVVHGRIHLYNGYSGIVLFCDKDGRQQHPAAFLLALW